MVSSDFFSPDNYVFRSRYTKVDTFKNVMLGIISLNVLRCLTHSRHSRHPLALTHPRQFKYSSTIEIFSFTIQIFLDNSYVLRQFKYSSANFPRQFKSRRQFKYSLAIQRFWQTFLDNSNICHQFEFNSSEKRQKISVPNSFFAPYSETLGVYQVAA